MNALIFGSDVFRDAFARDHATGLQPPEEIAALVVSWRPTRPRA